MEIFHRLDKPIEGWFKVDPRPQGVDPYKHFRQEETEEHVLSDLWREDTKYRDRSIISLPRNWVSQFGWL